MINIYIYIYVYLGEVWNAHLKQSVHLKQNVITIHAFWSVHFKMHIALQLKKCASQNAHCIAYQNTHFVQSSNPIALQLKVHTLFKIRISNFTLVLGNMHTFQLYRFPNIYIVFRLYNWKISLTTSPVLTSQGWQFLWRMDPTKYYLAIYVLLLYN